MTDTTSGETPGQEAKRVGIAAEELTEVIGL